MSYRKLHTSRDTRICEVKDIFLSGATESISKSTLNTVRYIPKFLVNNTSGHSKLVSKCWQVARHPTTTRSLLSASSLGFNIIPAKFIKLCACVNQYGQKLENGSFNGLLGDVHSWKVDIASNIVFVKEYGSPEFIFTAPLQQEGLCIAVPSPHLVPNWKMVFRAFELEVWHWICFALTVSTIFWHSLNLLSRPRPKPKFIDSLFFVGRISISIVALPTKNWQRIFALSIMVLGFVLATLFEGSLLRLLRTRSYEKEITTLNQFRLSKYTIYTFSSNLIRDTLPENLRGRVQLFRTTDVGTDLMELVARYRNISYIGKKCDIIQRMNTMRERVHLVKECPRSYVLAYMMRRDNLLYRSINQAVLRVVAAGLDQSPRVNIQCTNYKKDLDSETPKAFELSDIAIAINILKLGYCVALICFTGEVLVTYLPKCFRKVGCLNSNENAKENIFVK